VVYVGVDASALRGGGEKANEEVFVSIDVDKLFERADPKHAGGKRVAFLCGSAALYPR